MPRVFALPTNVGLPGGNLTSVISNFTNWILGIFGFLAIISFLVSGMMYFFSAGDDKAQEKAKKQMTWSIMGVVIGLIGLGGDLYCGYVFERWRRVIWEDKQRHKQRGQLSGDRRGCSE